MTAEPIICTHGSYYAGECLRCEVARLTAELAEVKADRDRLLVECEAWRSWDLVHGSYQECYNVHLCDGPLGFDTIEAAVDALMAEQETGS
jgi:hypothetical protein